MLTRIRHQSSNVAGYGEKVTNNYVVIVVMTIIAIIGLRRNACGKYTPPSRIGKMMETYGFNAKVEWDPTIIEFGDDEEVITNDELSNHGDENLIKENEIAQIFRIDTDIFHFETPLCKSFMEFNYFLKIDVDVLTNDIPGFKTYDEYKDELIGQ
nr:hypothetical protein [Tanacetum cinerariifolium]